MTTKDKLYILNQNRAKVEAEARLINSYQEEINSLKLQLYTSWICFITIIGLLYAIYGKCI
jgi:hypothetical protein